MSVASESISERRTRSSPLSSDGRAVTLDDEQGRGSSRRSCRSTRRAACSSATPRASAASSTRRTPSSRSSASSAARGRSGRGAAGASGASRSICARAPKRQPMVVARGEHYALPEISAFVLRRAKQIAENALGETVERAVITVPANFNDLQRAATKVARQARGPRGAPHPQRADRRGARVRPIDRAVRADRDLRLRRRHVRHHAPRSVGQRLRGARHRRRHVLGGDDVDVAHRRAHVRRSSCEAHSYDPRTNPEAFARLRIAAEDMKIQLSDAARGRRVELTEIGYGEGGDRSRSDFA